MFYQLFFFNRKPGLRCVYSLIDLLSSSLISAIFSLLLFYLSFFFLFPCFNWTLSNFYCFWFSNKGHMVYRFALVSNSVSIPDIWQVMFSLSLFSEQFLMLCLIFNTIIFQRIVYGAIILVCIFSTFWVYEYIAKPVVTIYKYSL